MHDKAQFAYNKNILLAKNEDDKKTAKIKFREIESKIKLKKDQVIVLDYLKLLTKKESKIRIDLSEADLNGANLSEAKLIRADFKNTKNIPAWIKQDLDENGIYKNGE